MHIILRKLMDSAGHNAYHIFQKTGVHPSTLSRFFSSPDGDFRPVTARKIANFYGITESQLRGDVPIEGMEFAFETPEHLSHDHPLTLDEYALVTNLRKLSKEARASLNQLTETLVKEQESVYRPEPTDRRKEDVYPNRQLRAGESRHHAPPNNRRLQELPHGQKYNRPARTQTA